MAFCKGYARTLEAFREKDQGISASQILLLLHVAMDPGHGPNEYATRTGLPRGVVSRELLALGPKDRTGKPGLKLLDSVPDEKDYRYVKTYITRQGLDLLERLEHSLEPWCMAQKTRCIEKTKN